MNTRKQYNKKSTQKDKCVTKNRKLTMQKRTHTKKGKQKTQKKGGAKIFNTANEFIKNNCPSIMLTTRPNPSLLNKKSWFPSREEKQQILLNKCKESLDAFKDNKNLDLVDFLKIKKKFEDKRIEYTGSVDKPIVLNENMDELKKLASDESYNNETIYKKYVELQSVITKLYITKNSSKLREIINKMSPEVYQYLMDSQFINSELYNWILTTNYLKKPNDLFELFRKFKYVNTRPRGDNILDPMYHLTIRDARSNKLSSHRYKMFQNWDTIIESKPLLFKSFFETDTYGFNQNTFNNLYGESFGRAAPFILYHQDKVQFNSLVKDMTDPDWNSPQKREPEYIKIFDKLFYIGAIKKSKLPLFLSSSYYNRKWESKPSFGDFKNDEFIGRIISLFVTTITPFSQFIFGSNPGELSAFYTFQVDNDDNKLCNSGFLVVPPNMGSKPFKYITEDTKKIYDDFLKSHISMEDFDYDTLSNNITKEFPSIRVIDFDHNKAYGIQFCEIKFYETQSSIGLCVQLIIIDNILDRDISKITLTVKDLVIWHKVDSEDVNDINQICPIFARGLINPIQDSLKSVISRKKEDILLVSKKEEPEYKEPEEETKEEPEEEPVYKKSEEETKEEPKYKEPVYTELQPNRPSDYSITSDESTELCNKVIELLRKLNNCRYMGIGCPLLRKKKNEIYKFFNTKILNIIENIESGIIPDTLDATQSINELCNIYIQQLETYLDGYEFNFDENLKKNNFYLGFNDLSNYAHGLSIDTVYQINNKKIEIKKKIRIPRRYKDLIEKYDKIKKLLGGTDLKDCRYTNIGCPLIRQKRKQLFTFFDVKIHNILFYIFRKDEPKDSDYISPRLEKLFDIYIKQIEAYIDGYAHKFDENLKANRFELDTGVLQYTKPDFHSLLPKQNPPKKWSIFSFRRGGLTKKKSSKRLRKTHRK